MKMMNKYLVYVLLIQLLSPNSAVFAEPKGKKRATSKQLPKIELTVSRFSEFFRKKRSEEKRKREVQASLQTNDSIDCHSNRYFDPDQFSCNSIMNTLVSEGVEQSGNTNTFELLSMISSTVERIDSMVDRPAKEKCDDCYGRAYGLLVFEDGVSYEEKIKSVEKKIRKQLLHDKLEKLRTERSYLRKLFEENKELLFKKDSSGESVFSKEASRIQLVGEGREAEKRLILEEKLTCQLSHDFEHSLEFSDLTSHIHNSEIVCSEQSKEFLNDYLHKTMKESFGAKDSISLENMVDVYNLDFTTEYAQTKLNMQDIRLKQDKVRIEEDTTKQNDFFKGLTYRIAESFDDLKEICDNRFKDRKYSWDHRLIDSITLLLGSVDDEKPNAEAFSDYSDAITYMVKSNVNYAPYFKSGRGFCSNFIDGKDVNTYKEKSLNLHMNVYLESINPQKVLDNIMTLSKELCPGNQGRRYGDLDSFVSDVACSPLHDLPLSYIESESPLVANSFICKGIIEKEPFRVLKDEKKSLQEIADQNRMDDLESQKTNTYLYEKEEFEKNPPKSVKLDRETLSGRNFANAMGLNSPESNEKFKEVLDKILAENEKKKGPVIFSPKKKTNVLSNKAESSNLVNGKERPVENTQVQVGSRLPSSSNERNFRKSRLPNQSVTYDPTDILKEISQTARPGQSPQQQIDNFIMAPPTRNEINNQISQLVESELFSLENRLKKEGNLPEGEITKALAMGPKKNAKQKSKAENELEKLKEQITKNVQEERKKKVEQLDKDKVIADLEKKNKQLNHFINSAKVNRESPNPSAKGPDGFLKEGTSISGFQTNAFQPYPSNRGAERRQQNYNDTVSKAETDARLPPNLGSMVKNRAREDGTVSISSEDGNLALVMKSDQGGEAFLATQIEIDEVILGRDGTIQQVHVYGTREPIDIGDLDENSRVELEKYIATKEVGVRASIEQNKKLIKVAKRSLPEKSEQKTRSTTSPFGDYDKLLKVSGGIGKE